ncbi:MAG: glycoside hydrolase family 2 TIM barrel-domain containing protein [Lacunisphaera sp.]|nr:glycoside hydrolase family 2 TIM barrel-domain containing protein [Lacunisphaera sp.]
MKKILSVLCLACVLPAALAAQPVRVELRPAGAGFELRRNGEPFFILGAGGVEQLDRLAGSGANSVRTWGSDQTAKVLDVAGKVGLTVCAGLWIEQERRGFNYDDPAAVAAQIAAHKRAVDQFKNHPSLLLWAVGNEVEAQSRNPKVWDTIEAVAAYIRQTDPNHPVMVVTAHVSPGTVALIKAHCPSVQLLGCNSYAGLSVLAQDVRKSGWPGPYLVTEWGSDGNWEVPKTPWGAELEPTSTEKAFQFALRYSLIMADYTNCLGSYAFYWGQKQETTPTWFNLYTEDGAETEAIEVLQFLWTGLQAKVTAPRVTPLLLNGQGGAAAVTVASRAPLRAEFALARGERDRIRVKWELLPESSHKGFGGDAELRPAELSLPAIPPAADPTRLEFSAPKSPGAYRLFITVYGPGGKAATANIPFLVAAPAS